MGDASRPYVSSLEYQAWKQLRDSALIKGTKPSTTFSRGPIEPSTLLGSYFSVWDSHTEMEAIDDFDQEISWLHLTVDSSPESGTPVKDETKSGVKLEDMDGHPAGADPETKLSELTFATIHGCFRWWSMVGSFKGLYKPKYLAKENIWLFGGVTWQNLDDDGEPDPDEDVADRNTNDFGLAAIVTLDSSGKPFLEMLYNATRYYARERETSGKVTSKTEESKPDLSNVTVGDATDGQGDKSAVEYVRVLWKKQKVDGETHPLEISHKEAQRLMRDAAVDLSDSRKLESLIGDGEADAEGDDYSDEDVDDEAPGDEENDGVGIKREVDDDEKDEREKSAKKRKL